MLKFHDVWRQLHKATIGLVLLALLASCGSGKVDEEKFSLYIGDKSYDELVSALQSYSSKQGYHVTMETLAGPNPETTARHIMVEGDGMRVLFQSALAEQCKEREGRRDVEYSHRVFDVNAFTTSYFQSNLDLSKQVIRLKGVLTNSGFRVVSRLESCNLL
jgi:hypothetical protein